MSARQLVFAASGADTSLDLNFLTGALDPRITFTRADTTPVASYFDSTGTMRFGPVNAIRNSTMVGAAPGTPGTLPTNWSAVIAIPSLPHAVVGFGTDAAGWPYIDLRFVGTASSTGSFILTFDSAVAASAGQAWTQSMYVRLVGGSLTGNISGFTLQTNVNGVSTATAPLTLTATTQRPAATVASTIGGTTTIQPYFAFGCASGVATDFTIRIGAPQLELGPVATQYIPTSGTASGGPRFDYDPVTHAAKGLLIEEARTNSILRSTDLTQAVWTKIGSPTVSNTVLAPDGTTTGQTVSFGTVAGPAYYQIVTLASGTSGQPSFWINPVSTTDVLLIENPANIANGKWSIPMSSLTPGVWQRITSSTPGLTIITPFSGTAGNQAGVLVCSQGGTISASFWGWQFETGAFSTSYIPTTTVAVTRAADVATMPVGAWFNQPPLSLAVECAPGNVTPNVYNTIIRLDNNTGGANDVGFLTTPTSNPPVKFYCYGGSTGTPAPSFAYSAVGARMVGAFSLTPSLMTASFNGGATGSSPPGTLQTFTTLRIGSDYPGTGLWNGYIRRVRYWPRALSGPELQQATS